MPRRPPRSLTTRRAAEHVAKSKQVSENVFDAAKSRGSPGRVRRTRRYARVTESIVALTLFGIGENRISFRCLFEFLFRFRIALVLIGMILMRKAPIGLLQILLSNVTRHTQHFVIIAFIICHTMIR